MTGATLVNQSCAAAVYWGRGPLTLVGARVEQHAPVSPSSPGALVAGVHPGAFAGACALPVPVHPEGDSTPTFGGSVSVVDASFVRSGAAAAADAPALAANHSLFVETAFLRGFRTAVVMGHRRLDVPRPAGWSRVGRLAVSQPPAPYHDRRSGHTFVLTAPVFEGGRPVPRAEMHFPPDAVQPAAAPPADLQGRHVWDEATFPTFQSPGRADAQRDCGALGDGVADDHAALQRCVDEHDVVVLPRGFYRLGSTLELRRPGGALVGVGRTSSVLMTATRGLDVAGPLLRVTARGTTVYALECVTFWHVAKVYLLDWRAEAGVWRQAHGYRTCDVLAYTPHPAVGPSCALWPHLDTAVALNRPLSVVSGGGRFYTFYIEDWHFQGPKYRHLMVDGSHAGLAFYHLNTECSKGEAEFEVSHSAGVAIFGMKAEGNAVKLWLRNSSDVLFTGFGGFGTALPINATYPPTFSQYTPSLIRVEASTNVSLANVWGACRIGPSLSGFGGMCYSPALWSTVLWGEGSYLAPLVRPVIFY